MRKVKNTQKVSRVFSNLLYMLKLSFKFTPSLAIGLIIEGVLTGIFGSFNLVIALKLLFDSIQKENFISSAIIVLVWFASNCVASFVIWLYQNVIYKKTKEKLHMKMQEYMFSKVKELDISCYDNPQFYDDFVWAMRESDGRITEILKDIRNTISQLIGICTVSGLLAATDPVILVLIVGVVTVTGITDLIAQKIKIRQNEELTPVNRRIDYITRVFSLPDYSKELRLSQAAELLEDDYDESVKKINDINVKYGKKHFGIYVLLKAFEVGLCTFGISIWLIFRMYKGEIMLGDFAASQSAIWNLFYNIQSTIKQFLSYRKHSLYVEKFRKLIEYIPKVTGGDSKVEKFRNICFDNVTFSYSSEHQNVLSNVSFAINRGEKIAIVGYNGAGKTTLIKLLLHLYDPSSGKITYNGTDIKKLNLQEYRKTFGTVFQDYKIYAATLAENVLADVYSEDKENTVLDALEKSSFDDKLADLPQGIMTPLDREYDENGVLLSGGESQKVAISRVFAGDQDIFILDEPSSALDPIAEYEINKKIIENSADKTVIIVSHRLSTTRNADRILMFDSGRLIEEGSHEELMKAKGKYYELFSLQAEKYVKGAEPV